MTKQDLTLLVLVVDRSGSMEKLADAMTTGIDHLIKEQAAQPGALLVTLVDFDTEYRVVYSVVPGHEVPPYQLEARGMTALLDAIGHAIDQTGMSLAGMAEEDRPGQVVFAIITDGEENSSSDYTAERVRAMIEHQEQQYQWKFLYLGANQDAFKVGARMGLAGATTANYAATPQGTVTTLHAVSATISAGRGGGSYGFTPQQREDMVDQAPSK